MFKNSLFSVLLFCAYTVSFAQEKPAYTPEMQVFHSISSNEIYAFVEELCKPEYQGRQAGSPEYMACAHWVANRFAEWGLKPGGDQGSYFQHFPIHYTEMTGPGKLEIITLEGRKSYQVAKDYFREQIL